MRAPTAIYARRSLGPGTDRFARMTAPVMVASWCTDFVEFDVKCHSGCILRYVMNDTSHRSRLGATLRALRNRKGWTLAEVSRRTGFSTPTLSKIENDKLSLSYDKLIKVSEGLGVEIADLFAPSSLNGADSGSSGRRSVNRRGEGELVATANYDYRYLSTDVIRKKFIPIVTEVRARSIAEFGELVRHPGEEFIFVIEGEIEVHSDLYAPIILRTGESVYLDSAMGHAYIARGAKPARLIAVCSASESNLKDAIMKHLARPPVKTAGKREQRKRSERRR
jgi:DNA-binding XRE family transcriptional regulator/mannose-6-phosphate isomerase-like protein (cupin superfamily)